MFHNDSLTFGKRSFCEFFTQYESLVAIGSYSATYSFTKFIFSLLDLIKFILKNRNEVLNVANNNFSKALGRK